MSHAERFFHKGFVTDICGNTESDIDSITSEDEYREILKDNLKYKTDFNSLERDEANQQDASIQYTRAWIRTINLAIACIVLGVLSYRQK